MVPGIYSVRMYRVPFGIDLVHIVTSVKYAPLDYVNIRTVFILL